MLHHGGPAHVAFQLHTLPCTSPMANTVMQLSTECVDSCLCLWLCPKGFNMSTRRDPSQTDPNALFYEDPCTLAFYMQPTWALSPGDYTLAPCHH